MSCEEVLRKVHKDIWSEDLLLIATHHTLAGNSCPYPLSMHPVSSLLLIWSFSFHCGHVWLSVRCVTQCGRCIKTFPLCQICKLNKSCGIECVKKDFTISVTPTLIIGGRVCAWWSVSWVLVLWCPERVPWHNDVTLCVALIGHWAMNPTSNKQDQYILVFCTSAELAKKRFTRVELLLD